MEVYQKGAKRYIITEDKNGNYTVGYSLYYGPKFKEAEYKTFKEDLLKMGYATFRNIDEISWYATLENNTPYKEDWKNVNGVFIPVYSHSVGKAEILNQIYNIVCEWSDIDADYTLMQSTENSNFYYVIVNDESEKFKGTYSYEFYGKPTLDEVEDTHYDAVSQMDIDKHEVEYGADSPRGLDGEFGFILIY